MSALSVWDGSVTSRVEVEIVLLRIGDHGLDYRYDRGRMWGGEHPDDAALRLAGHYPISISHSTSWRFETGVVVLTYAVLPDPMPQRPAVPLLQPAVVCSADPRRPSPAARPHHVAAHAVRHLSELVRTDPIVRRAALDPADRELWAAIQHAAASMATVTAAGQPAPLATQNVTGGSG